MPLTLAWFANLVVLLAGVVWVVYGLLFAFPDDEEGGLGEVGAFKEERLGRFRSELGTAFALSLLLSWGVKDVIAPLVIACLPLQSSRGMWVARILNGVLGSRAVERKSFLAERKPSSRRGRTASLVYGARRTVRSIRPRQA